MSKSDPLDAITWEPPPDALLTEPSEAPDDEFKVPAPVPDVQSIIDEVTANPSAKLTDQLGQALRAGLGIGALSILPDLIADLRRTKDPDSRLKFLNLAFKEGGYGVKEDKTANLPVFHFNFVGDQASLEVVREVPAKTLAEAPEFVEFVEKPPTATPASANFDELQESLALIEGL